MSGMKNPFRFLKVLLLLSLAVSLSAKEKETVKIAYLPITHAYPLFVEQELYGKNLENTKIELVRFGSWLELVEALNAGKVDGASILFPLAVKARENGIALKAVALGHRDGNVFVTDKEINNIHELKGKTVAIPSRLSAHYILLHQALKSAGMTVNDIKITELPPPEMPAALAEKRISGYIVAEPFGAKAVALGKGKVLQKSEDIWKDSMCCALVLRSEFITNKPLQAKELTTGYLHAARSLEKKEHCAVEAGKKYLKVPDKVLEISLNWISYADLGIKKAEYDQLIAYMKELDLIKKTPAYEDFVDNNLISNIK